MDALADRDFADDVVEAVVARLAEEIRLRFDDLPDALAAVTARIEVRQELRLPKRECVVRKPEASHCNCLALTLDELIDSGQSMTRDEVLKAARQAHNELGLG